MHIDLRMLMALVVVEASGSIGDAARRLTFSAAAVSGHLRALERECGVQLVRRTASGVELNDAGRRAVPLARLVLVAAGELEGLGPSGSGGRRGEGPRRPLPPAR